MKTDPECIFCRIVAGEVSCAKILEDDVSLAFLDIGPLAEGHVLLIPRDHHETVGEMPAELCAAVCGHIPALARAVRAATGCEGVNVLQNNGRLAHQVVPHVHFHLIPRKAGDEFHFNWPAGKYAEGHADRVAGTIRDSLE